MPTLALLLVAQAHATWSIIAVDPETREVGAAGATCSPMVWMIEGLAPDHGAVVAQYATWLHGRDVMRDALAGGATPADALQEAVDIDDKPELRQWAVVGFDGPPASFQGDDVEEPARIVSGDDWSVQGNTLATEDVVVAAADAFAITQGPLADRLMAALSAGAAQGGDARCDPDVAAKSAFLYVAGPDDKPHAPTVEVRASGKGAVDELAHEYATGGCSTAPAGLGGLGALVASLIAVRRARASGRGDRSGAPQAQSGDRREPTERAARAA